MTDEAHAAHGGKPLTDADIRTRPRLARRSLLAVAGAGLLAATAAMIGSTRPARAGALGGPVKPGAVFGPWPDGRLVGAATGITDTDRGPTADGPNHGRGAQTGVTDTDSGPYGDQPGRGRGVPGGPTDWDAGPDADPPGRGRGGMTGVTDQDTGLYADQIGRGHLPGTRVSPNP